MDAEQSMLFDDGTCEHHHRSNALRQPRSHPLSPRPTPPLLRDAGESLSHALQRTHISRIRSRTPAEHDDRSLAQHAGSVAAAIASVASAAASGASSSLPSPSFASTRIGSDSDAEDHASHASLSPHALPPSVDAAFHSASTAEHLNVGIRSASPMRVQAFAQRADESANESMEAAGSSDVLPPSFAAPESSPAIYRPSKSRRLTMPGRVSFTSAAAAESQAHEHGMRARTPDNSCAGDDGDRPSAAASLDRSCPADEDVRAAVRSAFFAPAASSSSSSFAAASSSSSSAVESGPSSVLRNLARHGVLDLPFFAQIRATIMGFAGEDADTIAMAPQSRGSHGTTSAPHSGVKLRTRTIRTPTREVAGAGGDDHAARQPAAPSAASAPFSQQPRSHSATAAASHAAHAVSMDQSAHQLVHPQHHIANSAAPAASSPIAHPGRHVSPLPLLVLTRPKRRRTADDIGTAATDSSSSAPFVPFLSGLPSLIAPFSPRASVAPFGSSTATEQSTESLSVRSQRIVLRYRVRAASPQEQRQQQQTSSLHGSLCSSSSMHTCSPPSQSRRRAPLSADAASSFISPSLFPAPSAFLSSSLSAAASASSASSFAASWSSNESIALCAATTLPAAPAASTASFPGALPSLRVLQQQAQFWRAEQ